MSQKRPYAPGPIYRRALANSPRIWQNDSPAGDNVEQMASLYGGLSAGVQSSAPPEPAAELPSNELPPQMLLQFLNDHPA